MTKELRKQRKNIQTNEQFKEEQCRQFQHIHNLLVVKKRVAMAADLNDPGYTLAV